MAEETLSIRLDDEGTPQTAAQSASALEFLIQTIDRLGKTEADGGAPVKILDRLGVAGRQAGSALAAGMSGTLDATLKAVAGTVKLSSALELATKRAQALKREEDKAFDAAVKAANVLPKSLQMQYKTPVGAQPSFGFGTIMGLIGKVWGQQGTDKALGIAKKFTEVGDQLGPALPLMKAVAGVQWEGAKIGAKMIAGAAIGLTVASAALVAAAGAAAYKLLHAGAELAIKSTTFREDTENALEAVLKNAKAARDTYEAGIKVAVELGLDKEDTLKRIRSLVTTGFRGEELTVIVRAVADFREAKGEEAANALQKGLEKIKSKGVFNQEAINSLAEPGLSADLVLAKLAKKLGISIEQVKGKLKAGSIDVATGIKAILDAANEQAGGAAEKAARTLPRLVESAKTLFESLFDKVDIGPLKDVLETVKKMLSGPEGEKLKDAANKLFGTIFKIFGDAFKGPEGEARLQRFITGLTKLMEGAAVIIEAAGPKIIQVIDGISKILDRNGSTSGGSWLQSLIDGIMSIDSALNPQTILMKIVMALSEAVEGIKARLFQLGADLIGGLIQGIMSNGGGVAGALVGIVSSAVSAAAGPKGADAHSPSRKTGAIGGWMGEGLVVNVLAWRDRAASAGASVADRAVAGMGVRANDNAVPIAPAAPSSPAGGPTIIVQIQMPAGTSSESTETVRAAAEEGAYVGWQKAMSRFAGNALRRVGT